MAFEGRWLTSLQGLIQRLDRTRGHLTIAVCVCIVLLIVMPPTGLPNDNEHHYFAIASYSVDADSVYRKGSLEVLAGAQHTVVFSTVVGYGLQVLSAPVVQVLGTAIVLILFSWAIASLFRSIGLGLFEVLLVLFAFIALGQEILGGEWLFGGFEPKAVAYPLVILAIARVVEGRLRCAAGWLGAATYFHFLVAGVWFGFIAVWLLLRGRSLAPVFSFAGLYVALSLPMIALVLVSYGGHLDVAGTSDEPSVSWIYSYFRMAHHVAPFADRWTLLDWLPGMALLVGVSIGMGLLLVVSDGDTGRLGRLAMISLIFLLGALALAAIDREGVLGPLNLFRPSSLALLLFLTVLVGTFSARLDGQAAPFLKATALTLVAPMSVPMVLAGVVEPTLSRIGGEPDRQAVTIYVIENTAADSTFLLHQEIERDFLDFEARTSRPALVLYKFIPTSRDGIREWYRRIQFRDAVFTGECPLDPEYEVDYLLIPMRAAEELTSRCGEIVFSTGRYAIIAASLAR